MERSVVPPALQAVEQRPLDPAPEDSSAQVSSRVTFVGALPPPVTGMTAMTAIIVNALSDRGEVRVMNWSRGKPLKGWRWKIARGWGATTSLARLLARGRVSNATLYYPASHGMGLYYDLAIVGLAKLLGYRVVLHHHVYTYIDRYDWRMARLVRMAAAHAVHCEPMSQDLRRRYSAAKQFWIVPPTIVSQQLPGVPPSTRSSFVLGFLSNVSLGKGIDEAIETFHRLLERGHDLRFVIAGPCQSQAVQRLIDDAVARSEGRVEYRGPVYGQAKSQFFADIDALVFPTRSESWGIVITEAMASGKPVLTRARGCIPWIVDSTCGLVVPPSEEFIEPAVRLVELWMESPNALKAAQTGARERSAKLVADAERELPRFVDRFFDWSE
jgi:glycosyltransferase involved in cell wall biosynthesis